LLCHLFEAFAYHLRDQALSLDERYLYVTVRVTLQAKLKGDVLGKAVEELCVGGGEVAYHCLKFSHLIEVVDLGTVLSEDIVELVDKLLHRGDELDKTFGDEDSTEVPAKACTLGDEVSDLAYNVVEGHAFSLYLF
jgi:siroheme synthase (precorrin-2 oxidase/ferrochelatase)